MNQSGYARIDELAGGELFGDYSRAFPESSRDAGRMLRVAVQTDQVDRYQALLEGALRDRKPVAEEQWHGLCATVSWPRPLPAWDRALIEQWRLDMNPDATPDWPEEEIICVRHRGPNPWQDRLGSGNPVGMIWFLLKALACAACVVVVGSALRVFPARIAGPIMSRFDRLLAAALP